MLTHRVIAEELTSFYDDVGMRCERDAFDTLFDHAPDKLQVSVMIIIVVVIIVKIIIISGNSLICAHFVCWVQLIYHLGTISGGEEEPGDFCEQAPEQDQPGGD